MSPGNRAALVVGALVAAVVLSPPTEAWVHSSLAAHMVQHVTVVGVVAPLVALGSPAPGRTRSSDQTVRSGAVRRQVGWLTAGVLAQTVLVLAWHAPPLFDAAEHTPALHAFEHLCLFAGAWLLWWAAIRAGGPAGWGPGALAVFVALLPMTVLGVGMTFAETPWYHHHDDLVDQQLGGVVMWAGGGVLALVGGVALGVAWIGASSATVEPSCEPAVDRCPGATGDIRPD